MAGLHRRLVLSLAFVLALILTGVVGFIWTQHESLLDALLTTVSAISTVGYSPPHPFTTAGKILALGLIVGGLVGLALVVSSLTEYFIEGHLPGAWERRKLDKALGQLSDHFIICGFGRVGREVARQLVTARESFVVLDLNAAASQAAREAGYLHLQEDASQDEILRKVHIERARALVACADSDVNNVYVTLSARAANSDLFIVARAAQTDAEPKLYRAGANRVVSPYVMAGRHMAELAARPLVADYLNLLFDGREIDIQIQEIAVDGSSSLSNRTIKDVHETVLDGAFVLALDRDGTRTLHVGPNEVLREGDRLLIVGSGAQLRKLSTIK